MGNSDYKFPAEPVKFTSRLSAQLLMENKNVSASHIESQR